ncbi:hypothetical protein Tco_0064165 [Tanacetum coccineum]
MLVHLVFTLPHKLRTSPRVPTYLDKRISSAFRCLRISQFHDLDRFFNEMEFFVDLDFIQRFSSELRTSLGVPTYFNNRDATLLQTLDLAVHDLDRFFNEMKFFVDLDFIQRRYFQHDLVSYLKLEGFSSYVSIALLTIAGGLDAALDLDDFLSRLVDDLWANELTISNFSPTDR